MPQTVEVDVSGMDENNWNRVADLFDLLLCGADAEKVVASESDPEIRCALLNLWQHHVKADAEDYLGSPVEFAIVPVFQPGQVLIDRFRIDRMLGSGGMGEVYLAWDLRVEDRVAIKTIARLLSSSLAIRKRFSAEVQSARRVTHPNVCRIHELFEEGDTVFFSMEYVEGAVLPELLAGGVNAGEARAIAKQMAEALRAAHRIGVVHGDFKPGNVMIVPATGAAEWPRAVIMDFGLAHALDPTRSPFQEEHSIRAGTVEYMAPELQRGGPPTFQSDIFAFGKVARELLPKERIWDECLRPAPEDRPASMDEVVRRLEPRTSRRYWIGGGVIALSAAAQYMFRSSVPPAPKIPADARVLVNGFRSAAGQQRPQRLTRSLLLTALEQSPRIRALADEDVLAALRRIQPGVSLPLAGSVLTDLIQTVRAAFWIDGDLRENGSRFSLDVRLMAVAGQNLVSASSFRDAPSIIAVAQAAALWVRQTAGESDRSLTVNPTEIGSYTSEVPEALQKYFDAMEHYAIGEMDQALPLLEEAIRLDPKFAQAHNALALTHNAARRYGDGFREIELAVQLATSLPERERAAIEMNYSRMTEDPSGMVEAAKRNLAYHPDEPRCHGVLAQTLLHTGSIAEGVVSCRNALNLAPDDWTRVLMLESALVEAGEYDQALGEFQRAQSGGVSNRWIYNGAGAAYMGMERYDEAIQAFTSEPADGEKQVDIQGAKTMLGHFDIAIAAMEEQAASAHSPMEAFKSNEFLCGLHFITAREDLARRAVREMAEVPAFPPMAHNFSCAASWAHRLKDDTALGKVLASVKELSRRWENGYTRALELHARALEASRRNAVEQAQQFFLQSSGSAFDIWTLFDMAEFFTRNAKWELAEEYWQKFEARRGMVIALGWFPGVLVMGWLYRAAGAQARGDRAQAFGLSQKVLNHWFHKNPGLPIVQAAQQIHAFTKPR